MCPSNVDRDIVGCVLQMQAAMLSENKWFSTTTNVKIGFGPSQVSFNKFKLLMITDNTDNQPSVNGLFSHQGFNVISLTLIKSWFL